MLTLEYFSIVLLVVTFLFYSCERETLNRELINNSITSNAHFELNSIRAAQIIKVDEDIKPVDAFNDIPALKTVVPGPDGIQVAHVEELKSGIESTSYRIYITQRNGHRDVSIGEVVNLYDLAWSPEGSKLAFCEGTILHIADSDGRTRQQIYKGPGGPYPGACFNLHWSANVREISFIQVENVHYPELRNPVEVIISLGSEQSANKPERRKSKDFTY